MSDTKQPIWNEIYRSGNSSTDIITFLEDTSGVYTPEMRIFKREQKKLYTILAEKCYLNNGILSDNKYHLDHPVWFSDKIVTICQSMGLNSVEFIANLCGDNLYNRCFAYYYLTEYFGCFEFDQYPL